MVSIEIGGSREGPGSRAAEGAQPQSLEEMAAAAGFVGSSADTGLVVQNVRGEIVAASVEAQEILGLSFEQMRGRTSQDSRWAAVDESGQPMPGTRHPAMRALYMTVPVNNSIMGVHRPNSEDPGRHVWLDVDAVPLTRSGESRPWAVVTSFRPITGYRLRELELRDSERLYRMIAEHSSDMVAWQLIADSTFLWVSPASRAVLGVGPDELIGKSGSDLVHAEDQAALQCWRREITTRNCQVPPLTLRMRHSDGTYRWIERTAHVIPGGPPSQMITTQRDVTDRVVAERARDAAVDLFQVAMEHATIGVAFKVNGTMSRVNPALCGMLGRSASELEGHELGEFTIDVDGEPDREVEEAEGGHAAHDEVEQQLLRPDGTSVWCTVTNIALPEASSAPGYVLMQCQDVTARKEAAARLERAALTDSLTGLPNRAVLEDRLNRALASAQLTASRVGVLFIDLDNFKRINDTHGHEVGDTLLREVGRRLASTVRHTDTVVRLGGDEFVIIREHVTGACELDGMADRIRAVIAEPLVVDGNAVTVTASVGAAIGGTGTAREMLSRADEAMYQVKRRRPEQRSD